MSPNDDATLSLMLSEVGQRVRALRLEKGLARRVLSDMCGVSPRYLAQLEAGEGNISITRLTRVAQALDQPVTALLSGNPSSEAAHVAGLFSMADATTQAQVLRLLDPDRATGDRAERLCLIGLRGAGKSTLGRALAQSIGAPFLELNKLIEAQAGIPLAEIMALYDIEGYRKLEAEALATVAAKQDRVVLAVAGGIVANPETFSALRARFHTVWLRATPEEHMARVRAQGDTRPMAGNPEAMAQLRTILQQRERHYAQADAVLDTSGQDVATTLAALQTLVAEHGFIRQKAP